MAAVLKHLEIPANTEGSVTAKCKQCTQIIAGSTKVTSISVKHLKVIFGPMFSGKTTELMRRIKRYQIANYKCFIIKYSKDNRYDDGGIATHDRQTLAATATTALLPLMAEASKFDVIGVDEGQFFPDVVQFCEKLADQGKTVLVAALDGTYQRKGFGNILELVPLAENVIKLTAVCMSCYGEAAFTKRKGLETEVEVIGGADKYLATCRACYKSPEKTSPFCSPGSRKLSHTRTIGDRSLVKGRLFAPSSPLTDRTNIVEMEADN